MSSIEPEDLLFREYDQQYQQYRHLDGLVVKYSAFYIAFITAISAISAYDTKKYLLLLFILFFISIYFILSAMSIRIIQKLIGIHIMEIRKALLRMLSPNENRKWVCDSYLKLTNEPPYTEPQTWCDYLKDRSIQDIVSLFIFNSFIGAYLIKNLVESWLISYSLIIYSLIFVALIFPQGCFVYWRFQSSSSEKRQKDRENTVYKSFKEVCEFSNK